MPQSSARSTEDIFAFAVVVILNWLLAHLATTWVLPSEVQSAVQTLITIGFAAYLNRQPKSLPAPLPQTTEKVAA